MTHRITDAERIALARVPTESLIALAAPARRLPRELFAAPALLNVTLQRLVLARLKARELCLITRSHPS